MATLTALCCDEATVVLCSRLRKLGFEVSWLYMDELRHGRIEPEALADSGPPDVLLYASPGNPGMARVATCIPSTDYAAVADSTADAELGRRLWEVSEERTGVSYGALSAVPAPGE